MDLFSLVKMQRIRWKSLEKYERVAGRTKNKWRGKKKKSNTR
jgi:hypothetical protein